MSEPRHAQDCKRLSASGEFIFPETKCSCGAIRYGTLGIDGWAGGLQQPVGIIGETPKRYRILALTYTYLAGRGRRLYQGESALVPKSAVKLG